METTNTKIQKQERKDRYVCYQVMKSIFGDLIQDYKEYGIKDWVDTYLGVNYQGKDFDINIEIKERNKTLDQMIRYPSAELKVSKYERMRKFTKKGYKLYYLVLLNQDEAILYDLDKIDFDQLKVMDWKIKKTQYDDNSGYEIVPVYIIPWEMAIKRISCKDFFKDYYKYHYDIIDFDYNKDINKVA